MSEAEATANIDHGVAYPQCCAELCTMKEGGAVALSEREKATIRAALSLWYCICGSAAKKVNAVASGGGRFDGLTDTQVKALCTRITGEPITDDFNEDNDGNIQFKMP